MRSNLPDHEFGKAVREEILYYEDYRNKEYVLEFEEPVVVEPLHGMIVARGNGLVRSLMAVHRSVYVPPPHFLRYCAYLKKKQSVPAAVLLRHHYGEENYFHFYADVLSVFKVLKKFPEYKNVPFLVSRRQFETPYFRGFVERARLSGHPWIVQDGQAVKVERLIVARGTPLTELWLQTLWDLLCVPEAKAGPGRKIYVMRDSGRRRRLVNRAEVEALCREMGFETVDTGSMSLDQQIELFRDCSSVVAEQGAGSSNVLFRRGRKLTLLELVSTEPEATCFFLICRLMGHEYQWVRGAVVDEGTRAYTIPIEDLKMKLAAL